MGDKLPDIEMSLEAIIVDTKIKCKQCRTFKTKPNFSEDGWEKSICKSCNREETLSKIM